MISDKKEIFLAFYFLCQNLDFYTSKCFHMGGSASEKFFKCLTLFLKDQSTHPNVHWTTLLVQLKHEAIPQNVNQNGQNCSWPCLCDSEGQQHCGRVTGLKK